MLDHSRRSKAILLVLFGLLTAGCDRSQAQPESPETAPAAAGKVAPAIPGEPFPAGRYVNVNPAAAGGAGVDLAGLIGRKPILLFYWIAGNPRADSILQEVDALVGSIGRDKLELLVVAVPRPGHDEAMMTERATALGLTAPVLRDDDFRLGQILQVQSVPHMALIDRQGTLRLSNGASLQQTLEYKMNIESAIRRAASGADIVTYGALPRYYPVIELAGKPCPDFRAPLVTNRVEKSWKSLMDPEKLNVLIFWSVDCGHCRKELPEINGWLKQNPGSVNVVSAASITDDATQLRTREFCEINDFQFPTLIDRDSVLLQRFNVTSTPTILIIRPDGIVDSAITHGQIDFGATIEGKKRELLEAVGS